jgi:hypothetical protein
MGLSNTFYGTKMLLNAEVPDIVEYKLKYVIIFTIMCLQSLYHQIIWLLHPIYKSVFFNQSNYL